MKERLVIGRGDWDGGNGFEDKPLRLRHCAKCRCELMPLPGMVDLYILPRKRLVCIDCAAEIDAELVKLYNLLTPARCFAYDLRVNADDGDEPLNDLKAAAMAFKTPPVGIVQHDDGSYGISAPLREAEKLLTLVPPPDAPDAA